MTLKWLNYRIFKNGISGKKEHMVEVVEQNDKQRLIIIALKKVAKKCKMRPILQKGGEKNWKMGLTKWGAGAIIWPYQAAPATVERSRKFFKKTWKKFLTSSGTCVSMVTSRTKRQWKHGDKFLKQNAPWKIR